ncbi:hypothetical protein [Streptomyces sp. NPDC052693]|uniref:hypothetical protein n=1 Tax=Streptomyces sp. NPDC052693 TaxID=3155814 RepID=UPI00341DA90C
MPQTATTIDDASRMESQGAQEHQVVGRVLALDNDNPNHSPEVKSDPVTAFEALTAKYGLRVVEWDISVLEPKLRESYVAHCLEQKGDRIFVVPVGQDPHTRLSALSVLLARQEVAPV